MALSSAKISPSNQSVEDSAAAAATTITATKAGGGVTGTNDLAAKNPPVDSAATTAESAKASDQHQQQQEQAPQLKKPPPPPSSAASVPTLTNLDTEHSEHYVLAQSLLRSGDFENAMSTIEEGMGVLRVQLVVAQQQQQEAAGGGDATYNSDDPSSQIDLHEAMAPFYYLYGTTLLYSIEESPDQNMTTVPGGGPVAADGAASASAAPEEQAAAGQGGAPANDDDMEIAWENLETARTILQSMVKQNDDNNTDENGKLLLDLAQVHLRLGDLQKLNGRYQAAIDDYDACLKLRRDSKKLGPYDRKIADVHYNLGLVYMLHAVQESSNLNNPPPSTTAQEGEQQPQPPTADQLAKIQEGKNKSFHHSLECAKAFCGQIAFLCDTEPTAFFEKVQTERPNYKTTGEEEQDIMQVTTSLELNNLRHHASELQPSSTENAEDVADLLSLLEEIQETIDEAKTSQDGVQEITQMKEAISAMAASDAGAGEQDNNNNNNVAGGGEASAGPAAAASSAFGSSQAAASTAAAQPLQVRKKKKKRDADEAKLPATDANGNKRPAPTAE